MDYNLDPTSLRLAIVIPDKCKPSRCGLECKKNCPVVRMGKLCIVVTKTDKTAFVSEVLCNGCGICSKKCPFGAIKIVRLPQSLSDDQTSHRYGPNGFKLHHLPIPRRNHVLGIVGENGLGKTTVCKILSGVLKPNLGKVKPNDEAPAWDNIVKHFRGSELQTYFKKMVEGGCKVVVKPQHVLFLANQAKGASVRSQLEPLLENGKNLLDVGVVSALSLTHLLDRDLSTLSGGELQRVSVAVACLSQGDVFIVDEPCAFLDIKQRLNVARALRQLINKHPSSSTDTFVIVVEHDLSIIDFLCDFICLIYGTENAYGVVSHPFGAREGLNIFLDGYIKSENMKFRQEPLTFVGFADQEEGRRKRHEQHRIPAMRKTLGDFTLDVQESAFRDSEITVLLGENGTGKTTFVKLLAGIIKPDVTDEQKQQQQEKQPEEQGSNDESLCSIVNLTVSYKPQVLQTNSTMTVRDLFNKKIPGTWQSPDFSSSVIKPFKLIPLLDEQLCTLSGGQLQRVCIAVCLGKDASLYLLDEPSTFLDVEQRIAVAKVVKRFIRNHKKVAFVVEHDLMMGAYLADHYIVFEGKPGVSCTAHTQEAWTNGLTHFLKVLGITMRKDFTTGRPRVNKPDSLRDREQKNSGNYLMETNIHNDSDL